MNTSIDCRVVWPNNCYRNRLNYVLIHVLIEGWGREHVTLLYITLPIAFKYYHFSPNTIHKPEASSWSNNFNTKSLYASIFTDEISASGVILELPTATSVWRMRSSYTIAVKKSLTWATQASMGIEYYNWFHKARFSGSRLIASCSRQRPVTDPCGHRGGKRTWGFIKKGDVYV